MKVLAIETTGKYGSASVIDDDGRVFSASSSEEMNHLRGMITLIDEAVRDAYGWSDIDLGHGFHEVGYLPANDNVRYTISEPARIEILKRLSALNRQRWEEEEAAGLHKKGKK